MSEDSELRILDAGLGEREFLEPILKESFEGWYLRHSLKTLREVGRVRIAKVGGEPAGLAMLKSLDEGIGYVYYVAVARGHRRKGIGSALVDDAIGCFRESGMKEAYASVENDDAARLFGSKGFGRTEFSQVSGRYGFFRAMSMYRSMLSVPGELLLRLDLTRAGTTPSSRA